ncbi:uncharacterized protein CLUP02_11467 [Colletotrichum lupini]|uniref:Uncharacterized protein n=1 Tax=Colletotrichum lupini TaxID=145971 RepID=A0A9Q8SZA3_9PEZI|nr:uncharacterized protein CLUP02_11467 [Colletotrichum lupini]UQC85968.1 hypothetical protein CLUP02_11467 [Colletotrichum lupini]
MPQIIWLLSGSNVLQLDGGTRQRIKNLSTRVSDYPTGRDPDARNQGVTRRIMGSFDTSACLLNTVRIAGLALGSASLCASKLSPQLDSQQERRANEQRQLGNHRNLPRRILRVRRSLTGSGQVKVTSQSLPPPPDGHQ